ncbi:MAG: electron transport complex subunit E [Clostridia bacterium]|nr:electron transport complex subunit E [Clostridia bacterium]
MENNSEKYSVRSFLGQLKSGIIEQNPTLVQVLGMCPTLATTTSLTNAIGMGLATTVVLAFSNLFISLLRKFIPKQVRIAAFIVIISGFVTAVEMLMKAYFTDLYQSLGVFISLIVVNCIILARAEAFASNNKPLPSIVDGLSMGLGFTCALCLLGTVREILGAGTVAGISIFGESFQPAQMFIMPAGAFITLGCLIALVQKLRTVSAEKQKAKELAAEEAADASEGGNDQ